MSIIERAALHLEALEGSKKRTSAESTDASSFPVTPEGSGHDSFESARSVFHQRAVDDQTVSSDRTKKTSRTVSIDLGRLDEMGLVSPLQPQSRVMEEFRVIKRPLLQNVRGSGVSHVKNANLIMVTSALVGERKTTSSVSLALSMAMELDRTVLLVDGDVARPSVLRTLGVSSEAGLLDLLVDPSVQISDVLVRTNVEKLTLLPSGRFQPHATELLASEAMARLLAELATRYSDRIIVFDSPPLLITNEARVLAGHMGQIVVVVEAESTKQAAVREALAVIEHCPVKLLVLNKAKRASRPGNFSYYGYGSTAPYGYGT